MKHGAKGSEKQVTFSDGNATYTRTQVIPDWRDDIFLEKLNQFIQVLGERYDGNPNIAYIDIRSYGNWGEQHLGGIGEEDLTAEELKSLYIEPYMRSFHNTLLVNPWGKKEYNEVYKWAIEQGISIRRDGIFESSNGTECFMSYGKLPSIFEYKYNYTVLKQKNLWNTDDLLEYVEIGKPSYVQIYREMYDENKEFCDELANKIGYYFKFKGAEYTNTIKTNEFNSITLNFINEGVAPLYEPCTVYIGLLDENYQLVKKYKTDIDPHTWMPNESMQENIEMQLDGVEDGTYIISLGLFLNEEDEQPTYLLGNAGKTDEKWYVFGEIHLQNPIEEYSVHLANEDTLINSKDGYKIDVQTMNLKESNHYTLKIYDNQKLMQAYDMQGNNQQWIKEIYVELEDGKHAISMQIEKNDEIVYELEKDLYVCNFETEYVAISNRAVDIYTEFQTKFAKEIAQVPGLSENIYNMKNYMIQVGLLEETILETSSIEAMKMHYYLGDDLLQAYQEGMLQIEFVQLNAMLCMLEDIGNAYEDLVTVTAKTRNAKLEETKQIIEEAENIIGNNEDLEIVYPSEILNLSKEQYNKAEYINEIEEENDIKTGLIVSTNLHGMLLAQWSNSFANLYIDNYIKENPVTVQYSETEWTNQDVKARLETTAEIEIVDNEYNFTENGKYTFKYSIKGKKFTIEAVVQNIDKDFPVIEGVEEGKVYTKNVIPQISDVNLQTIELYSSGQAVEEYTLDVPIEEEGIYQLKAIDKAGNVSM